MPLHIPAPGHWVLDRGRGVVECSFTLTLHDGTRDALLDALDRWMRDLRRSEASVIAHPELIDVDGAVTLRWPAPTQLGSQLLDAAVPIEQRLRLLDVTARALDALHAHGVVHGGLGIDSVWIANDQVAFPDAALNDALSGILPMPPLAGGYAAPEVRHAREPEAATDVFALAVVAHEILSGATRTQIAMAGGVTSVDALIVEPNRALYPGAPPAMTDVIARGVAASPSARYASCGLFIATLQRASRATPPTVPVVEAPPERTVPALPLTQDRRGLLAKVIACGLAVGALYGYCASPARGNAGDPTRATTATVVVPRAPDARIFVDGVMVTGTDSIVTVAPGLHDIEVQRADGARITHRLELARGQVAHLIIE